MSHKQRLLARHALGLPNLAKETYRNRFYGGKGTTDFDTWKDMERLGFAKQVTAELFMVTRAGAELALEPGEKIDR